MKFEGVVGQPYLYYRDAGYDVGEGRVVSGC